MQLVTTMTQIPWKPVLNICHYITVHGRHVVENLHRYVNGFCWYLSQATDKTKSSGGSENHEVTGVDLLKQQILLPYSQIHLFVMFFYRQIPPQILHLIWMPGKNWQTTFLPFKTSVSSSFLLYKKVCIYSPKLSVHSFILHQYRLRCRSYRRDLYWRFAWQCEPRRILSL